MDRSRFGSSSTGRLVATSAGERDWAFIPSRLPRRWDIPLMLWPLLSDAKAELARLDGIGRTLPDPELLLQPLNNREAIRSSSLEGTFASAEELLLFELDERPPPPTERVNDWIEVRNYALALREGTRLLNELPLSLRIIREMHRVLLSGVRGRDRAPGEFRRIQVHIGADKRFVPPPVNELGACLDDFEHYLNEAEAVEPLIRTFLAHYQFEATHPFADGNGRVGRALLSLCAYKWCGLSHPWLYMSSYYDQHKDEYIDRLFAVSSHGAWNEWLEFCLRGTIEVCRDAITRCDELRSLRDRYHSLADGAGGRMHRIVEMLFSRPIVTISSIARRLGVTYPTAKADLDRLVAMEIIRELPNAYPKAFIAGKIFDAAYAES
jgi:Fic family protein